LRSDAEEFAAESPNARLRRLARFRAGLVQRVRSVEARSASEHTLGREHDVGSIGLIEAPEAALQMTAANNELEALGGGCPPRVRLIMLCVVILPFVGLAAVIAMLWHVPFQGTYLAIMVGMYVSTGIGIGTGFHRLFTHRSFSAGPYVRFFWAALGSMAIEGPLTTWVAEHRKHHQHSDAPGDPHSPHARHDDYPTGIRGVVWGVWHAHVGWLFEKTPRDLERYVPDLLSDPGASFVSRTYWMWVALGLIIPAVLGGVLTGTWTGALLGFLWGGLVRTLVVHHITWCINSVCHLWGTRPFRTRDESRDNPIFGILAFGEGWHNAHHAFPTSARHGLAWWKLDINYIVIRAMALVGLAHNVRLPSPDRLAERRRVK
jgi:stearoyl-CoA desaturase (delta-9 desaturase)